MTDEELAEEWCKENMDCVKTVSFLNHGCNYFSDEARSVAKSAFLAGLKAGKGMDVPTKWHDLRKDPNDLPKIEIGRTSITVLNEDGNKVYYDYYTKYWRYDDEELHITTPPIAWCEIPKFSE